MMEKGKGRATGYTDYYKNTAQTPNKATGNVSEKEDTQLRKEALKRRLKRTRKTGTM